MSEQNGENGAQHGIRQSRGSTDTHWLSGEEAADHYKGLLMTEQGHTSRRSV